MYVFYLIFIEREEERDKREGGNGGESHGNVSITRGRERWDPLT